MGLLDKLFKSPAEDLLSRGAVNQDAEVDPLQSVQEMYGITAQTDATGAAQGAAPAAGPVASPQAPAPSPAVPGIQAPTPISPAPAPSPAAAAPEGAAEANLESPLRSLFTESSVMDPQLQALLGMVERVEAQDLLGELQEFSKALGAESSDEGSQA